ncbi:hypothetical protein [Larkinella arboricola]|uniref:hypothetical protein n=1 Tax=Larkinella arboricola TaxID=643671 RepID=UPI000DB97EFD|nr:hypothetical protein [Larkinella arboricola]
MALLLSCERDNVTRKGAFIGAKVEGKVASYDASATAHSSGVNIVNRYFVAYKVLRLYAFGNGNAQWIIYIPAAIDHLRLPYTFDFARDSIDYNVSWKDVKIRPIPDSSCPNINLCSFMAQARDAFSLTITKLTPTSIEGSFSGQMQLVSHGSGPLKEHTVRVRNGKFSVNYDREN